MKNKITKETSLEKILKKKGIKKILEKYHVPCLFCPIAEIEMKEIKIGQIAEIYGIDLDNLLKELNKIKK